MNTNRLRLMARNLLLLLGLALAAVPLLDFGLLGLASAGFICLNAYALRQGSGGFLRGVFVGLPATALWFGATFLLVFQVHLWRGGQV